MPSRDDVGSHAAEATRTEHTRFQRGAQRLRDGAGSPSAAVAIGLGVVVWLLLGFAADFPRWWELVNTCGVPVLTLLMFVVLQHTQNHDARATQLKLDELIRAHDRATNRMMTVEDASERDLDRIREDFEDEARIAEDADVDGNRAHDRDDHDRGVGEQAEADGQHERDEAPAPARHGS